MEKVSPLETPLLTPHPPRQPSYQIFLQWRQSDLVCGLLAILGLVCFLIDYEYHYTDDREVDDCLEPDRGLDLLRSLGAAATLGTIVFWLRQDYLLWKWKGHAHPYKRVKFETFGVIVGLLLMPYPGLYGGFAFTSEFNFVPYVVCYTYSELLLIATLVRLLLFIQAMFSLTKLRGYYAGSFAGPFYAKANLRFCFKSLMRERPLLIMVLGVIIPIFLLFAFVVRVFERPAVGLTSREFDSYFNVLYFVMISMSTVGYGDFSPATTLGRFVMMVSTFFGCFVFSLVVVSVENHLKFSPPEKHLYDCVELSTPAAICLQRAYRYHRRRRQSRKKTGLEFAMLMFGLKGFRRLRENLIDRSQLQDAQIHNLRMNVLGMQKTLRVMAIQTDLMFRKAFPDRHHIEAGHEFEEQLYEPTHLR